MAEDDQIDEAERARLKQERKQKRREEKAAKKAAKQAAQQENSEHSENTEKDQSPKEKDRSKKQKLVEDNDKKKDDEIEALDSFEKARAAFPKESLSMFDVVTAGFKAPTPIQAQTWGATLSGQDVIGIATTGSGKTLAFTLPVVAKMLTRKRRESSSKVAKPQALVLAPTRELCTQNYDVAVKACKSGGLKAAVTYGGQSRGHQLKSLQAGVDFLVATPGRLIDFLESGDVEFDQCDFIVLDEADRMLDMGFEKDVRKIMKAASSRNRQTLMFSATWPESIRAIAAEFLKPTAKRIALSGDKLQANVRVEQHVEVMDVRNKDRRLIEILNENKNAKTIVFALYKKEAERVQQDLQRRGFKVAGVHGDKTQSDREAAVAAFTRGECLILVATDVASRGLDIKGVELVINYTFPLTVEDYVHRIGRTGRAGASGRSVTFFTEHDKARAGELQNVLREAGAEVPEALTRFGSTVKKKEHALYGAHYKKDADLATAKATVVTFDSDDE